MLELDEMTTQSDLILDLQMLNQISQTLNQATDVHAAVSYTHLTLPTSDLV